MIVQGERSAIFIASTTILIIFGSAYTSAQCSSAKPTLPINAITSLPIRTETVLPIRTETSLPAMAETPRHRGEVRRSIIEVIKGPCVVDKRTDAHGKCRLKIE